MDFCNEAVFAFRAKKPLHAGVRTGCHHSISPSVCATFVILTDCESCTRPISTISGSIEAGKNGLTRGTCFFARCLEVVAVAGLLWLSWCVFGGAGFFSLFIFFRFFFSSNAYGLLQVRGHLASYTSLLVIRPFFAFRQKKPLHTGVRTGCHYLISLSVCVRV